MKKAINSISESEFIQSFPEKSKIPGWRYSIEEASNLVWLVTISNRWGNATSRRGTDLDDLILECEAEATELSNNDNDA